MGSKKLTRRQFAGVVAVAATAPALLTAQEKKPAEPEKKPAAAPSGDDESQAMKRIRDFTVPEGAEPAFAFRADWN